MINKKINNSFLLLFSILPVSILAGPAVSLINILLIDIFFLILIIFKKEYSFLKNDTIKYFLIFYIYLIMNSFISIDKEVGFLRNFGFLRFIILFVAFNYFFKQNFFLKKVLFVWSFIISFILVDIFIESFTGQNLAGYGQDYGRRIVSFFKNEAIVGGYVNAFYLIIIGFLFFNFKEKNKSFILIYSIIFLIAIFMTGERSNSIKAFLGFLLFYLSFKDYDFKKKTILLTSIIILFSALILNSQFLKMRFINQIQYHISQDQIYFKLYRSGYEVFKNNIFFGVGNKNYRIETCKKTHEDKEKKDTYFCNTHPHQIYFEMLSEHGLLGSLFIFFIFYKLIFSKIKCVLRENNYIQIGSLIYLTLTFLPLIPSGAFFSDYMLNLFIINLSIMYSSSKKLNIFNP